MTAAELARLRVEAEDEIDHVERYLTRAALNPIPMRAVQIRAYIAALEAQVAALDGWRPVTATEPAPGVKVLMGSGWDCWTGWRVDGVWYRDNAEPLGFFPTHYRPLPEPPEK